MMTKRTMATLIATKTLFSRAENLIPRQITAVRMRTIAAATMFGCVMLGFSL